MPGWSDRVRFAPGDRGYAYVPGQVLVQTEDRGRIGDIVQIDFRNEQIGGPAGSTHSIVPIVGDVPSAVAALRGAGLTAQPNYVYFLNALPPQGVQASPVYASPVYASPVYASPVYASPVYASPVYASPVYASAGAAGGGCGCDGHCADTNGCTCTPAAGAASLVYPHPIFAKLHYTAQHALRYQMTGLRPTQAKPLYGVDSPLPGNADWDINAVRVAVIDTGWPDPLAGAEVPQPCVRGDQVDVPAVRAGDDVAPVSGHGAFIAGLIAQRAPGCSVQVCHALSIYGDGNEATIANVIDKLVADPLRPHVLSLSFNTYTPDDEYPNVLRLAIQAAIAAGVVVVASAGNDGTSRKAYPAAFPGVVSVAALGPNGPAEFSNWGDWVVACAPGVDVPSGFWHYDGPAKKDFGADPDDFEGWALWSGTSFAAPIVAAAIVSGIQSGIDPRQVVGRVVTHPSLYRLACYGTVINPPIRAGAL